MAPRFPLALSFLLLLASPTFAALSTGAEHEVTPRALDIAASQQNYTRIATNGSEFLAVWTEGEPVGSDILAARLAPSGATLDRMPLVIADTSAREQFATVEWGGDRYLVVWMSGNDRILGRFVFSDGTLTEVFQIATRSNQSPTARLEVAFNGRVFLVAWHDGAAFQGTIVDRAGRIGPTRELVRGQFLFDLLATRDSFYFVYLNESTPRTFVALQLDDDVRTRSQFDIISTTTQYVSTFRAEPRGDEFLLAWMEPGYQIHSVRVTPAGVQEHLFFDTGGFQMLQAAAADDAGYVLIYGNRDLHWRRPGDSVESNVPLPAVALSSASTTVFSAASNGSRTIALVHTLPSYDVNAQDLFVSVLEEDLALPLVLTPQQQTVPDAAAAGDVALVIWKEIHPSDDRVVLTGRRVDAHGIPLGDAFAIGSNVNYGSRPGIASNGTGWLVTWENESFPPRLFGRRVQHDGTFVDAAPLLLAEPAAGNADVTWDGTSYIVVLSSGIASRFPRFNIHVRRVPATGEPQDGFNITNNGYHISPTIAAGPNGSLVVWSEGGQQLRGVLLSQSGTVTPLAFPNGAARTPSVAWNGDSFLIAADSSTPARRELRWWRADASGNVSESPFTFRVGTGTTVPRVEPFGDGFLLYWMQDQQLFAALLQSDGTPLEAATRIAADAHGFGAAGTSLVIAHAIDHPTKPVRVFVQTIDRTQPVVRRRAIAF